MRLPGSCAQGFPPIRFRSLLAPRMQSLTKETFGPIDQVVVATWHSEEAAEALVTATFLDAQLAAVHVCREGHSVSKDMNLRHD